jgi:protein-S-isoprenylcysteine O-methyltransferase Ste14
MGRRTYDTEEVDVSVSLALRNLVFTVIVPGTGGVYVPWQILRLRGDAVRPEAWYALVVIAAGVTLYFWCAWSFGSVGGGTPGIWDPPRRVVATGPYRWVRNPIYLGALLIVSGEAWLFLSVGILIYAGLLAVAFLVIVTEYEEPTLHGRFGASYETYRRTVPGWIPHRPAAQR